jgi:O-antigen ligase
MAESIEVSVHNRPLARPWLQPPVSFSEIHLQCLNKASSQRRIHMSVSTFSDPETLRAKDVRLSQGAVLIPLMAGFITPSTPSWAFIFYLSAIPAILLTLLRGWRPKLNNPALAAMLSLWFWSALTILWNHHTNPHGKTTMFWIVNALWTLVLVLNFVSACEAEPRTRSRAMAIMVYGAAINATISLILFAIKGDFTIRLWGWGISGNPVMGAAIMDICLLLALSEASTNPRQRLKMAAAALPMILFLAFSYSRSALIALAAAMLLIFLGRRPALAILASLVIAGAVLLLWKFGAVLSPVLWENLASRGSDCHAQLWHAAWSAIRTNPIIGFGPSATLPNMGPGATFCPPYPSPHNLYLSILFYSGTVGLILFVITVALLWRHLNAATTGFARRLWLAVGMVPLIVGMTDLVQIIKGPSPMWYIVWMPMLLILTLPGESLRSATRALPQLRGHRSIRQADARQRYVR